jgi:hypothetical protein
MVFVFRDGTILEVFIIRARAIRVVLVKGAGLVQSGRASKSLYKVSQGI